MVWKITVDQQKETPVQRIPSPITGRYAYARAAESQAAREKGQDFITLSHQDHSFTFVLCDGVSLSFCGDMAAQFLGQSLQAFLRSEEFDFTHESLRDFLCDLTHEAPAAVSAYALPNQLPEVLREVLEEKRERGSETTFVCGRLDFPTEKSPNGRIFLSWMGDSRLRIFTSKGEHTEVLGDTFHTAERWSTHRGIIGKALHIHETDFTAISRIVVYSDGFSALDGKQHFGTDTELQKEVEACGQKPTSDDISFIELLLPKREALSPIKSFFQRWKGSAT